MDNDFWNYLATGEVIDITKIVNVLYDNITIAVTNKATQVNQHGEVASRYIAFQNNTFLILFKV